LIVGNGLIANAFEKLREREDVFLFASGVSNSLETDQDAFLREQNLLTESLKKHSNKLFIYFGTCSVYDPSAVTSPYVQHKLKMERIVVESGASYAIFRIPQIVGERGNSATLLNYLRRKIKTGEMFDLWCDAIRYLVDIDDVVRFVIYVIDSAKRSDVLVNLVTTPSTVLDILVCLEQIVGKKAIYSPIDKGSSYSIPLLEPNLTTSKAGIIIDDKYLEKVLRKYYAN